MVYYVFKDDVVYGATKNQELIKDIATIANIVDYEVGETEFEDYEPSNKKYVLQNGEIVLNENYEEELAQLERERIAKLSLTRGDVFRGLLQAKNVTRTQIRAMIENNETLTILEREMALIDFDEALNFYRGNTLIDTLGLALGITSEQLDRFFEDGNYEHLLV